MDIRTNTITVGDSKIFMQIFNLQDQKMFYFSDNSLKFNNLACTVNTGDEILTREIITDNEEQVNSFLQNFHKFLCKKFTVPVFASFNFNLKSNEDYMLFVKLAKEVVNGIE